MFGSVGAGPAPGPVAHAPVPDLELMAFKDQGVWYFLCSAPAFPVRVDFHALTYGPPPPCWGTGMPLAVPDLRSPTGAQTRYANPARWAPIPKTGSGGR